MTLLESDSETEAVVQLLTAHMVLLSAVKDAAVRFCALMALGTLLTAPTENVQMQMASALKPVKILPYKVPASTIVIVLGEFMPICFTVNFMMTCLRHTHNLLNF